MNILKAVYNNSFLLLMSGMLVVGSSIVCAKGKGYEIFGITLAGGLAFTGLAVRTTIMEYRMLSRRLPTVPGTYRRGNRDESILVVPVMFYPLRVYSNYGYYDLDEWDTGENWNLIEELPLPPWWGDPKFMS